MERTGVPLSSNAHHDSVLVCTTKYSVRGVGGRVHFSLRTQSMSDDWMNGNKICRGGVHAAATGRHHDRVSQKFLHLSADDFSLVCLGRKRNHATNNRRRRFQCSSLVPDRGFRQTPDQTVGFQLRYTSRHL